MDMKASHHLYADPAIYDILHDEGSAADIRVFARVAGRVSPRVEASVRAKRALWWLEPASGSGRYLLACAKRGDCAVGIDLSRDMIAYGLQRAREVDFAARVGGIVGGMEAFSLRKVAWADGVKRAACKPGVFDVAFNPINSIRHLASDDAMVAHLACVGAALHADGVYIVGLSLSAYGLESASEDVWVGKRRGVSVTQVVQFEPPDANARGAWKRRERVMSHLTITTRAGEEHRDSAYWLRTYNLAQWRGVVAKAGWRIAGVFDNTGKACTPSEPGYYLFALRRGDDSL
jgi:SAM-dependent methyltransferase